MIDDSEDIFRRAAENYPLKTDNPDWDALRKKMEIGGAASEEIPVSKKKNKRWLLLLLLLLPFAVIEYKYSPISNLFGSRKQAETKKTIPIASAEHTTGQTTSENKERTTDAVTIKQTTTPSRDLNNVNTTTVEPAVAKQKNNTTNTNAIAAANQTGSLTPNTVEDKIAAKHTSATKESRKDFANNHEGEKTGTGRHNKRITSKQKSTLNIKNAEATGDEDGNKIASAENTIAVTTEPEAPTMPVNAGKPVVREEPALKQSIPDTAKEIKKEIAKTSPKTVDKEVKKKKPVRKHFYVGLMAGPDLSTIKMQSVKKPGLSFGLIAGYSINKNISVETGFFKDEKKYSSNGKYFSTKNIQTYPNSTIEYVSGACYMYEIPLNVSYTFIQNKKSTVFATAGISSYLMSKESYDYDVKYYNTIYPYSKEYKSHDNQLAAVINISAGYTHKLGKIGDVRIEPYIKLPVNKVGTGDLPIQSFGIMFGITRKLF